jgi:CMP-N,N'-diacetyllegionaminic acid synthase
MMSRAPAIAALLPARLGSTRCKLKNLRPFGNTTLFEHALRFVGSREISRFYVSAFEPEFREIASRYPVTYIQRSARSAAGEDLETIYDFLDSIEEDYLITVNTCFPFLRPETFDAAVRYYREHVFPSMIAVYETPGWYFSADDHRLVTPITAGSINSKDLKPFLRASHAIFCWQKRRVLVEKRIWTLTQDDPHLYPVSAEECIDIDSELEFEIAEALYTRRKQNAAAGARA